MILGLTGVARSGKSTVASYLVREHGFVEHSFAAPIRAFVAHILGTDLAGLEDGKEREVPWLGGGRTPRWMMQTAGTEWGRKTVHDQLWVRSCLMRASFDVNAGRNVVISDVRFDNEAEAIRRAGGEVWRVERPGAGVVGSHASEAGVSPSWITRTVRNDSDVVADLHAAVGALIACGWHV
jgi:hypothetical protein